MKIRPIPAVLSLVITLAALFGGWWLYQSFLVKQPISQLLDNKQQVTDYKINVTPKNVTIDLQVDPKITLTDDYLGLLARIKEQSPQQNVTLTLKDNPNSTLQTTWNELYFIVAEGINQGEYHAMLTELQQYPLEQNVQLQVAMDTENLYVWLAQPDEETTLFQALPLHGHKVGTGVSADA